MANKHVTNPCKLSGERVRDDSGRWLYPDRNTINVVCPECYGFITINRASKTYRKHNVSQGRTFADLRSVSV